MKEKFIFFDFDGVIADTFSIAYGVQKQACPHVTQEHYRKRFEGNINFTTIPEELHTDECKEVDFFAEYVPKMEKEAMLIEGIGEVIAEFGEKYSLIVISSTISEPIANFLKKHNIHHHFLRIMGNDVHKSKVEKMKMVFNEYNVTSGDCLLITDTLGDIKEANELGVKSIGVTWGFHSEETLKKGNAHKLVENPSDLLIVVNRYFENI
jgi:phosphoglycolate phosphatase